MLEAQAFTRAVADAGIAPSEIDGLASAGFGGMHEVQLAEYLGITPRWLDSTSCQERRRMTFLQPGQMVWAPSLKMLPS